jgi:hypothetical protein
MKATTKRHCYSGQTSSRDGREYGDALASARTTFGSWKLVMVAGKSEGEPGRGRKDPYDGGGANGGREGGKVRPGRSLANSRE